MTAVNIRPATGKDVDSLYWVAAEMRATHESNYFERSLAEQDAGNRVLLLAEYDGAIVGYVQLNLQPIYQPFRRLNIPEIQDLNVIPSMRRSGIGGQLVDFCEALALQMGRTDIGIGVGLYGRYGAAQRLYVRKGYVPDGLGVAYDDEAVQAGDMRPIDDLLTLKLTKAL
jgi:GNAT superfamily N-acetyltransferase